MTGLAALAMVKQLLPVEKNMNRHKGFEREQIPVRCEVSPDQPRSLVLAAILFALLLTAWPQSAAAQEEGTLQDEQPTGLRVELRSVIVDVEWVLLMAGISGSIDVDILRIPSSLHSTVGLRFSLDHYVSGNVGGSTPGSPFTDYNVFLRHTASGRLLRLDFYGGWSYYTTSFPRAYPSHGGFKFGIELRLKVIDHFFALLLKLSKPGGFGGSLGWDR